MPIPVQVQIHADPDGPSAAHLQGKQIEAFLCDISEFGIGLISSVSLPWGLLVDLDLARRALPLAADGRPSAGLMRITGRVVHAIPNGNGYRVGISFTRMEEPDRALIRRLISPAPLAEDRRRKARTAVITQTADES